MCFFFTVVGIRPSLTSELRQRVHAMNELTPEEQDYHLLVTKESLIDCGLSQVSLGECPPSLIENELVCCSLIFALVDTFFLDFFTDMNSLNWASPSGRKSKVGQGVGTSATEEVACPK